ncbi:ABC transporter ATP-binding protein/permease [Sphingobacterium sp. lm-10]|uniref:ABC transporter ATP-binding protein n=1 Tax=Sphingobacterium sp. lm-10 TaxID=2944904 RepID=UPI00201FE569|nr:ABC transporter ATP-binding protein [Sphingobacterium sp. lm-10]MCL7988423.1 ABC transporter ATP-binding protein/permease [Sphingobacterium sp. lm-10]
MTYSYQQHISWIWAFTQRYRTRLSIYFILELSGIVFSLLFVYWSKVAIDRATGHVDKEIAPILILIVSAVLAGIIVRSISSWIDENTRLRMSIQLQNQITKEQMRSSWSSLKKRQTGDLMVRLQEDNREVVQMIGSSGLSFIITLLKLLTSLFFLWSMDPVLAAMIVFITPLFFFSKLYFKKIRALNQQAKAADSMVGNIIQENLRFRMVIRALGLLFYRDEKLRVEQGRLLQLKMRQINFSILSNTIVRLTMNAGYLIAFIWGVYRLHQQEISFGTMTAFLQLVGRIQTPILSAAAFVPAFVRFRVSLDRILELFEGNKEVEVAPIKFSTIQRITFENVSFKYEEANVIDNLSLEVAAGKPLAILGSSGRGKTTLMRLLLSLCSPDNGKIFLQSGFDPAQVLEGKHRSNFAFVPQGNSLFTGTIKENIVGELSVSSLQINDALELACASFVHDLPQGIHTFIGESGYGLSEGQAQRIAIARAVIRDVPVWLFDEPTSALDEETSARLIAQLLYEGKNKILIFVTHDLKLAECCDTTVYLH